MELKQISLSIDGNYLYALDVEGRLWVAATHDPGHGRTIATHPKWERVEGPPATPDQT